MRFRAQEYFFARNAFCAEKWDFSEKVEFHEKSGSGLKIHQFGVGIHTVSWILRIPVFPRREKVDFHGISRIPCNFHGKSGFHVNFSLSHGIP